ncbi:MAG: Holliday junction branch migration protein RuvA [Candidatus Heimdallarchaeota archaeon]|nr:Holliday junction branch migration protein RuvA [Candidatus Heimdallarchaeota archaeon]
MIGYLTGKIISKKPTQILLDVGGVGYLVNISISTFDKLPDDSETVSLHTYLNVREDVLNLFGFFTKAEKDMFELLISISGVGPKLAQSILSGIELEDLTEALKTGNLGRIVAIPGIGRKTGERMIVELRDKIDSLAMNIASVDGKKYSMQTDAVTALTSLGYNRKVAERTIRSIQESNSSMEIEELIKSALSILNK